MTSRSSVNDLLRKVEVQGTKGLAHSYMCGTCTLKATTADGRETTFDGKSEDAGLLSSYLSAQVTVAPSGKIEPVVHGAHGVCGPKTKWDAEKKMCMIDVDRVCDVGTTADRENTLCKSGGGVASMASAASVDTSATRSIADSMLALAAVNASAASAHAASKTASDAEPAAVSVKAGGDFAASGALYL